MANPLASFNTARRPVVVYSPGRAAPGRQQRVPLPRRTGPVARTQQEARTTGQRGPGVSWAGLSEAVQSTPAAQKKAQEEAQQQAEDAAYDDLPWYKKGLGMVLGNPIAKTFLYPLSAFSVPGKAITAGVETLAEHGFDLDWVPTISDIPGISSLPDPAKRYLDMISNPVVGGLDYAIDQVDTERTEADKRSFWEKIAPQSDYGYGQLLDPDNEGWVNNLKGFAGDVAFDPFTYFTGGAMKGANAIEKGAKIAELAGKSAEAEKFLAAADKVAEAARAGNRAATAAERGRYLQKGVEAEQEVARLNKEIEALDRANKIVPVRQGRKAREGIIGEVAQHRPELLAEGSESAALLRQGAERGFNTIRDPAMREALGLQDPALRFMGANLPGTGGLATKIAQAGGGMRWAANRTPLLGEVMAKFSSRGLEDASRAISRGGKGDLLRAGTAVRIQNLLRRGTASMEGRGNRELTTLIRELKSMGGSDTIRTLFREAETSGTRNRVNQFFGHDIPALYEKIAGRPMGVKRNPDTYVPHMMTPEWKRFLREHASAQEVEDLGFVADDLLEGSQYLEKSRKLTPDEIGTPKEFKIGDRTITLTDGTIDELNDQLRKAFPEFKRKAYLDDPARIGEAYVSSIARQAGRDFAMQRIADSGNPLVKEMSGDILAAIEARNKWSRTNPIIETVKKGYTKGQRLVPAKPKGEAPTSPFDEIFAWTKHVDETQQQRNYLFREGKQFVEDVGKDVKATRSTLADNLKALRTQLMDGLKERAGEAGAKIKAANVYLDRVDDEIKKLGPLTSENLDDVVAVAHTVDQQIVAAKAEIKKIRDRYGKKVPRSQARLEKELQTTLKRLEDQAEAVRVQYGKGSAEMRKEAAARTKALEAPIEAARTRVQQAEAAHPRPPGLTPERVQWANNTVRTHFETEEAYDAERQLYVDAIHQMHEQGIPLYRTVEGQLTPETKDAVRQVVDQAREPAEAVLSPEEKLRQAMTTAQTAAPPAPTPPPAAAAAGALSEQELKDQAYFADRLRQLAERENLTEAEQTEVGILQKRLDDLNQRQPAAEAGVPAPPTPEPLAPVAATPDTTLRKQPDGSLASEDGWTIHKEPGGWRVMLDGEDDFGLHKTQKQAKQAVEHERASLEAAMKMLAEPEEAVPPAAPAGLEDVVPPPEPTAVPTAAPEPGAAPKPKRITKKWIRKTVEGPEGSAGREVAALTGPGEGWTIEPFQSAPPRSAGPQITYPPSEFGPTRYAAFHPTDDSLRGVTFASEREAKIAVEDLLRKRRHVEKMSEYLARGEMRKGQVFSTYENLSGLREFPPTGLIEEEAAANRAAAQAVPQQQFYGGTREPTRQPTMAEQGFEPNPDVAPAIAEVEAKRPTTAPGWRDEYQLAWEEWQGQLEQSMNISLSAADRRKAERTARTLGGEFTQTTGKFHDRYAATGVLAEEAAWNAAKEADVELTAARAALSKAQDDAANQVEAIVYTKHHNPITGDDEYSRLPSGSTVGFTGEGERVPVLPKPPTQGEVPMGTRSFDPRVWESHYSAGERAADRSTLESGLYQFMPIDDQREWDRLSAQADDFSDRITASIDNEERIRQLDSEAKAAYTQDVRDAQEVVKEARRKEEAAWRNWKDRDVERAGYSAEEAEAAYNAAHDATNQAMADQTAVMQRWMDADRAWKQALADRDEYIQAAADVTKAEQAIHGGRGAQRSYKEGENPADRFIEQVRKTGVAPSVGGRPPSHENRTLAAHLRYADQRLRELEDRGIVHLDAQQRRKLQGMLNDIDVEKRNLVNKLMQDRIVKPGEDVLPRIPTDYEKIRLPGQSGEERQIEGSLQFLAGPPQPTTIPPVRGSGDDLAARAFAESLQPTEPTERKITSLTAEGAPQQRTVVGGTREYKPGTEREAIAALEGQAADVESSLGPEMQQELSNIASEAQGHRDVAQVAKDTEALGILAERDEKLLPISDRVQTLNAVQTALHEKEKMIPQRAEALAQRKVIVDAKVTKKADIVQVANDIEKVAKQNPDMLDDDLAVVEALLQDTRKEAERVTENDMTAQQVQGLIDKVATKDDKSIDIMLTTVGQNWRMLYEANGAKKAVLQSEDIIVEAELHRMFTNLYDLKKDHVLFGRNINAFTNLFKTYATLTPGFHIRNALSAIFMNTADGVGLRTQLSAAELWKRYMEEGEEFLTHPTGNLKGFSAEQIRDAFTVAHSTGAGGRFTEAGFAEVAGEGGWAERALAKAQRNRFTRWSQRVGERVEGSVRFAMALDSMKMGESIESAIQRVNRIHFDYGDISKLDDTMKRIIPFWTFMSRNMPMQVSQMWTHPRTYLIYENFVKNFAAKDEQYTPAYWTKAGVWNTGLKIPENDLPILGAASNLPIYAAPDLGYNRLKSDLTDYEDFLSLQRPGAVLSQVNPVVSAPIEAAFRQDIFTGQRFEKGETVPAEGILNFPIRAVAKALGQETGGEVDAALMNFYRAINPLQDRQMRLLPQITGGNEPEMQRQLESILRFAGGVPVRTLTPEQQQNEYFRRYYDQLDAMKRQQERDQRAAERQAS